MDTKTLGLGAAILIAGFLLASWIDGWFLSPAWTNTPGAIFPVYALAGVIAILVVTFVGRLRRKG
jgi:biotin transporter BioY